MFTRIETNMKTTNTIKSKPGPHTAEFQRRFNYEKKYNGLLDVKFFIDQDSVAQAKAEGRTVEELTEEIFQEILRMMSAPTVVDKKFF